MQPSAPTRTPTSTRARTPHVYIRRNAAIRALGLDPRRDNDAHIVIRGDGADVWEVTRTDRFGTHIEGRVSVSYPSLDAWLAWRRHVNGCEIKRLDIGVRTPTRYQINAPGQPCRYAISLAAAVALARKVSP